MKYYAVIDTNVLVAALFSKKKDAATVGNMTNGQKPEKAVTSGQPRKD